MRGGDNAQLVGDAKTVGAYARVRHGPLRFTFGDDWHRGQGLVAPPPSAADPVDRH